MTQSSSWLNVGCFLCKVCYLTVCSPLCSVYYNWLLCHQHHLTSNYHPESSLYTKIGQNILCPTSFSVVKIPIFTILNYMKFLCEMTEKKQKCMFLNTRRNRNDVQEREGYMLKEIQIVVVKRRRINSFCFIKRLFYKLML